MRLAVTGLLLLTACITRSPPVSRALTSLAGGEKGWFRVQSLYAIDDRGALLLLPATEAEDEAGVTRNQRVLKLHDQQYTRTWLDVQAPCYGITGTETPGPGVVFVLVHGMGGLGTEWVGVIATLAQAKPAGMFMYRWWAASSRGDLVGELVAGITQLARCYPKSPIVVLGHSAGGVLCAHAASRLVLPVPPPPVLIVTVAAPLAGIGIRDEIDGADDSTRFFADLGVARYGYPAALPGVTVVHFRTRWPDDPVMQPNGGFEPNAISAVVKGSKLIELPGLGHEEALLHAARELVAGKLPGPWNP